MIYFILFFILFVITNKFLFHRSDQKFVFYFVCCIFILLGSIRWETGTDWNSYLYFFQINSSYTDFMDDLSFEKGYSYLNYIVKSCSDNYSVFLFVLAFLTISLKSVPLFHLSSFPILSLLLYFAFYLGDITAVRQSLSISILVFSIFFIQKKQLLPFLLLIFIASSIHISSIVFVLAYFAYNKPLSNTILTVLLFLALIVGFIPNLMKNLTISIVGTIFGGRIGEKIEIYTEIMNIQGTGGVLSLIKRLFFLPVYLLVRPYVSPKYKYYDGFLNIFIFGNIIYILFYKSLNIIARASTPFLFFEVFLLSSVLLSLKTNYDKMIIYSVISVYSLSKLMFFLTAYWDEYVPYINIVTSNIGK